MNSNPYLVKYDQTQVDTLLKSGSISSSFDTSFNLIIENTTGSLFNSAITIPLKNTPTVAVKVESLYDTTFTEL